MKNSLTIGQAKRSRIGVQEVELKAVEAKTKEKAISHKSTL